MERYAGGGVECTLRLSRVKAIFCSANWMTGEPAQRQRTGMNNEERNERL